MISTKLTLNIKTGIYLKRMTNTFPFKANEIVMIQTKKLQKLINSVYKNDDFYREKFDSVGYKPGDIRERKDLKYLPIITKEEYRDYTNNKTAVHPQKYQKYYKDGTSGSTGIPLKIYRTWDERAYMLAKYMRALFLNGYKMRYKTFSLPSPHRIQASDSILQRLGIMRRFCVSYTAPVEEMIKEFLKRDYDFIYANKAQLLEMALYLQASNLKFKKPAMCLCAGEILDSTSKKIITSVFGGSGFFEVYGGVEFNNLAFQIAGEDYFHFNHDTNILELEEDGELRADSGNCLITDLHITSFPLIRYRLGDWLDTEMKDGVRVIKKIKGRLDDWVVTEKGRRIPFHHFYEVMDGVPSILQYRFIQETKKRIIVELVFAANAQIEPITTTVINLLNEKITNEFEYIIKEVASIEREKNGKLRMLISNLSKTNEAD
jgi:phenylacetate-coenzyme A ligase PaaK-like adenylate-forming protein